MTLRHALATALLVVGAGWPGPGSAFDRPLSGPLPGASTDFGQTAAPAVLTASAALPLAMLRDEIFRAGVETERGTLVFDNPRTTCPDLLARVGAELMFLVNNPHPGHDGGTTPRSEAGVRAFARPVVEGLRRFPGIGIVEVGAGGPPDPFERVARQDGRDSPLAMRPGQARDGVPWTPCLGTDISDGARASAEWVLPSEPFGGPVDIVCRYRVPRGVTAMVEVRLDPWQAGVMLSVLQNGRVLHRDAVTDPETIRLGGLTLMPGDVIEVVAAPNGGDGGSGLRVILKEDGG